MLSVNYVSKVRRKNETKSLIRNSCLPENFNILWGVRKANSNTEKISHKNESDVKKIIIGDSRTNLESNK